MNILFVSPTPFHPFRGGIGRATDTLTREFQKRGYQVFYMHLSWYMEERKNFSYPAPVVIFPSKDVYDSQNIEFYHNFLLSHKIDIIINQDGLYEGSYLFLNTGNIPIKKISVIHSNPIINYNNLWSSVYRLRNRSIIEKIKRIIRCCLFFKIKRQMMQHLKTHYHYIEENSDRLLLLSNEYIRLLEKVHLKFIENLCCIPNPNTYTNVGVCPFKKKEIICVGRLSSTKRIDRLLNIWSRVYKDFPEWSLLIVGNGAEEASLKEKAKQLAIDRVSFCGFQDPRPYYERASIICMTSDFEGFPMTLTEAMQFGCVPIVYNSFEAVTDIVNSGVTGELVSPFNQREFEQKLRRLMTDSVYRNTLSDNAFRYVKKYDVKDIADQWEKLFDEL